MNLYEWRSRMLANFDTGHIIVMAPSIEEARELAREGYRKLLREYYAIEKGDEFDSEMQGFENDLRDEPEIYDSSVIIIKGSG